MPFLQRFSARLIATANVNVAVTGVGIVIDGVTVADLDEVVLNGQTTQAENGLWVAHTGSAWTRHTDFDSSGEMLKGTEFYIQQGNSDNARSTWTFDTNGPITPGTTPVSFKREAFGPGAGTPNPDTFDRDPVTNEWGLKDRSTPTGYFSRVQIRSDGLVDDAVVSEAHTTFWEGLRLVYDGAAAIVVEAGALYIPSEGDVITLEDDVFVSGITMTANTWYYIYGYQTGGVLAIEVATQAPVTTPYLGGARVKGPDGAPDESRRYIGEIRCGPTANTQLRFYDSLAGYRRWEVNINDTTAAGGAKVLNAARATVNTIQSLSALVPPTSRLPFLLLRVVWNTTNGSTFVTDPDDGLSPQGAAGQLFATATGGSEQALATGVVSTDATQQIEWASTASALDVFLCVMGYWRER